MQSPFLRSTMVVAPLALALVVAACGGSTSAVEPGLATTDGVVSLSTPTAEGVSDEATPAPPDDATEALLAFAGCMRDNGIDMVDPQVGSGSVRGAFRQSQESFDLQSEEYQAAQSACGQFLQAARPDVDQAAESERIEQSLLLAACMRASGFEDYPDPRVNADGSLERFGGRNLEQVGIDPDSDDFVAAREICADETSLTFGAGAQGEGQ